MHWIGNVLQTALAEVLEWNLNDLPNLIVDGLRDEYSSGLRQLLQANCNVYTSAVKIILFGDDIPEVDTDAELHSFVVGTERCVPQSRSESRQRIE